MRECYAKANAAINQQCAKERCEKARCARGGELEEGGFGSVELGKVGGGDGEVRSKLRWSGRDQISVWCDQKWSGCDQIRFCVIRNQFSVIRNEARVMVDHILA